jgi:hypothetical protein
MPNSIDFRADQIQTKQIIVTGSGAGTTKLLIYGIEAQGSPANEGLINTTYFPQSGIGGDVFLYVSGAVGARGSAVRGTSVFGGDLVVSGSLSFAGVRHAIKVVDAAANPTTDMTRSDYLVLVNTKITNATVVLPEITNTVDDLGLTVEIRQMDSALSGRTVTIQPHASNSSYKILGFDNEIENAIIKLGSAASPPGTNTNRSVTLTFMGLGDGAYNKWVVIATSTC